MHISSGWLLPLTENVYTLVVFVAVLFTLYMDDLPIDLKKLGLGYYWDFFYVGAIA